MLWSMCFSSQPPLLCMHAPLAIRISNSRRRVQQWKWQKHPFSLLSCIPSIAPHSDHGQICGACSGACASPLSHLSFTCMHRRQFEFRIRGGAFSGGSHKHNTSLQDIPPSTFRDTSYATYTYGSGLGDTTGCHNRLSRPLPPNVCEFAKAVLHATCM